MSVAHVSTFGSLDHSSSNDSVSVASDLTRMYVSDEDDRHERTVFRVPHYH